MLWRIAICRDTAPAVSAALETMKTKGYPYVMLSTQEDETAKFFYEKIGYRRNGAFLPPEQEANEIMYLKELKP